MSLLDLLSQLSMQGVGKDSWIWVASKEGFLFRGLFLSILIERVLDCKSSSLSMESIGPF